MREFVYGTAAQFHALEQELAHGKKYKFANRQLPEGCTPAAATIWFAKTGDVYAMYIDKGITTELDSPDFKLFLQRGQAQFICMDDLVEFLTSLQPLFPNPYADQRQSCQQNQAAAAGQESEIKQLQSPQRAEPEPDVVDKQKLREIQETEGKPKMVWPEELAKPLKERVFGQDEVIDELANKVVISQMRKNKRLLVIALVGPTATGKSETAKSLAEVMSAAYNTPYGYIEIAGSEFIGEHTVHRFFGAPPGYVGHGQPTVLEPVRKNPHHVIVINEIEKADQKILVGLMETIDTGVIGMADNSKPINLNQCVLLFTSNIPIDMEKYRACTPFDRAEMCRDAFTKHCGRPEISGKIGNFLVFSPLSSEASTDIIVKFVREELDNYDLKLAKIDEYLMADFLKHQSKYGARGIRGLVSESVGYHLLKDKKLEMYRGKAVSMSGSVDSIKFAFA